MKSDSALAPITTPMCVKLEARATPPDISQKQRLFADALNKAGAKSQPLRPKLAEDQPVGAMMTITTTYASTALTPTPAPATNDATLAAHIERMAATIAEVTNGGAKAELTLTLPAGPTRIDGAVVGRDADGGVHIMLTTASVIAPATAAQLQNQLIERLLRRDIRITKMGLQRISRQTSET